MLARAWVRLHLRSGSFQHLDAEILVVIDSGYVKAAAAAAVATESRTQLAIELVLEQKNRQSFQEPDLL